jgi:integral membrane protein
MKLKTKLGQLRLLAISEGVSYLMLFALTMPLKYVYSIYLPNKIVGVIHGILFILFCIWVVLVARQLKWSIGITLICLASSLFPFATFVVDHKILKPAQKTISGL